MIRTARKLGFTVLSEIGKKLQNAFMPIPEQAQMIHGDLNSGAHYIIVEGREAGKSVGVYDADGNPREEDVDALLDTLGPLSTRLIWEAPLAKQQAFYVNKLGNKVNLGNIQPAEVVTLESLRRGFRSDTLRPAIGDAATEAGQSPSAITQANAQPPAVRRLKSRPGVTLWTDAQQRRSGGESDHLRR